MPVRPNMHRHELIDYILGRKRNIPTYPHKVDYLRAGIAQWAIDHRAQLKQVDCPLKTFEVTSCYGCTNAQTYYCFHSNKAHQNGILVRRKIVPEQPIEETDMLQVTVETFPRTLEEINKKTPFLIRKCMIDCGLLPTAEERTAFGALSVQDQARQLYEALRQWDKNHNKQPQPALTAEEEPAAVVPPPAQPLPSGPVAAPPPPPPPPRQPAPSIHPPAEPAAPPTPVAPMRTSPVAPPAAPSKGQDATAALVEALGEVTRALHEVAESSIKSQRLLEKLSSDLTTLTSKVDSVNDLVEMRTRGLENVAPMLQAILEQSSTAAVRQEVSDRLSMIMIAMLDQLAVNVLSTSESEFVDLGVSKVGTHINQIRGDIYENVVEALEGAQAAQAPAPEPAPTPAAPAAKGKGGRRHALLLRTYLSLGGKTYYRPRPNSSSTGCTKWVSVRPMPIR